MDSAGAGRPDGDGDLDIVAACAADHAVAILRNSPRGLVVADLDQDGDLDLATTSASGAIEVLPNLLLP